MKKIALLIGLLCGFIGVLALLTGMFSHVNITLVDHFYGGKQALDSIIIVAIDDQSIQEIGRWPWERSTIARVLDNLHEARVVGVDIGFFESSQPVEDAALKASLKQAGNVVLAREFIDFEGGVPTATLEPLFADEAKAVGYVNIITDKDGVSRAVNLELPGKSLSQAVYEQYWKRPLETKARYNIDYVGPPKSFEYISVRDVLAPDFNEEHVNGKIVLLGATAPNLHDVFIVPTSDGKEMPGVEIHANTIQTMITQSDLKTLPVWIAIIILLLLGLIIAWVTLHYSLRVSIPLTIGAIIGHAFLAIISFSLGTIVDMIYYPLVIVLAFVLSIGYSFIFERKEKRRALHAFGKYVSPVLIGEIMKDPDKLKLGGEKRDITVLFSDIRGFTSISEKLSPEELVHLLNEFLTDMTNIILNRNGMVDKFMGDAIMALWNAPLDQEEHANLAAHAALDMKEELDRVQENWTRTDIPHLNIGIGLNTGPAVVGNMGSYNRFDYTAMGDTVNLGSRLEGLTKQYNINIIVSEYTQKHIKKKFLCRKMDLVSVKGKKEPVMIYELIGEKEGLNKQVAKNIKDFEAALDLYFSRKFKKARSEFERLAKLGDGPSLTFIERCNIFENDPPKKGWTGVWVMKTK